MPRTLQVCTQFPRHGPAGCKPFLLTYCNAKGWCIPSSFASRSQQASPTTPSLQYQGLPYPARSWTEAGNCFHKQLSSFPASWLRAQSSAPQLRVSAALYLVCSPFCLRGVPFPCSGHPAQGLEGLSRTPWLHSPCTDCLNACKLIQNTPRLSGPLHMHFAVDPHSFSDRFLQVSPGWMWPGKSGWREIQTETDLSWSALQPICTARRGTRCSIAENQGP